MRVPRLPITLPLVAAAFVLVYLSRFPLQRFTQLAGSTFRFRENLWLWLLSMLLLAAAGTLVGAAAMWPVTATFRWRHALVIGAIPLLVGIYFPLWVSDWVPDWLVRRLIWIVQTNSASAVAWFAVGVATAAGFARPAIPSDGKRPGNS
ncbi:MAG: hypothetical protein OEM94_03370 [Acidimicrobiia bacterium]|nr:hypothetical protein [Acidimicrobiia bacterium]